MKLITRYMENLPGQTYKTRQFDRTIEENLPDDISKEDFILRAERQHRTLEALVKNDVERCKQEISS